MAIRQQTNLKIAAVLPCYRVRRQIVYVVKAIGPEVSLIIVVDDACPEGSGLLVQREVNDARVEVLFNSKNLGVGGAMVAGFRRALELGADVVVKIDGDGQISPQLILPVVRPIERGMADFVKGNRFFSLESLSGMPLLRVLGNSGLSFISKLASGYWNVMDPTNGLFAIHRAALAQIPLEKLDKRFFFESDLLFRLYTARAVVMELPMRAKYGDEHSSLKISRVLLEFPPKLLNRFFKRIFYSYFLRDFNLCSLQLLAGAALLAGGGVFGAYSWYRHSLINTEASTGTVMLAVLPIFMGFQLLLSAISYDVMNVPKQPLQVLMQEGAADNQVRGDARIEKAAIGAA